LRSPISGVDGHGKGIVSTLLKGDFRSSKDVEDELVLGAMRRSGARPTPDVFGDLNSDPSSLQMEEEVGRLTFLDDLGCDPAIFQ
jgi:hypothetical protein